MKLSADRRRPVSARVKARPGLEPAAPAQQLSTGWSHDGRPARLRQEVAVCTRARRRALRSISSTGPP